MVADPKLELIVAVDANKGIGLDGHVPWKLPTENEYFMRMTTTPSSDPNRKTVAIFGARTWHSLKDYNLKTWPNCICFVVSRTMRQSEVADIEDVYVCKDINEVVSKLQSSPLKERAGRVWVHGGIPIYKMAMESPHFYRLYMTKIKARFAADTFFPSIDETKLKRVEDPDVPQGIVVDNGVNYEVFVFETTGVSPLA